MKKRLLKTCIISLIFVVSVFALSISNKALCAPDLMDDENIIKLVEQLRIDLPQKEALYSLNVGYDLTYTKKYDLDSDYINMEGYSYNTVYYSADGQFTFKFIKNDVTDEEIVYDHITEALKIPYASNGNGVEIVMSFNDYYVREITPSYAYMDNAYTHLSLTLPNGCSYSTEQQEMSPSYMISETYECNTATMKNTSNKYSYLTGLAVSTFKIIPTNIQSSIKKVSGKNQCSMQIVGRLDYDYASSIVSAFYTSDAYYGMMYGKVTYMTDSAIETCKQCLVNGTTNTNSNIKLINEISTRYIDGYDETGFNRAYNTDTIYHQWGVSINNISDSNLDTEIVAIPYIRIKDSRLNINEVICFKKKSLSVKDLAAQYSQMDLSNVNDKIFLGELAK